MVALHLVKKVIWVPGGHTSCPVVVTTARFPTGTTPSALYRRPECSNEGIAFNAENRRFIAMEGTLETFMGHRVQTDMRVHFSISRYDQWLQRSLGFQDLAGRVGTGNMARKPVTKKST